MSFFFEGFFGTGKTGKRVRKRSKLLKIINNEDNLKVLAYLKDNKDKLEQKEKNLALISCVKKRYIASCVRLLELGANPSYMCKEKYGYNCLMIAVLLDIKNEVKIHLHFVYAN